MVPSPFLIAPFLVAETYLNCTSDLDADNTVRLIMQAKGGERRGNRCGAPAPLPTRCLRLPCCSLLIAGPPTGT